MCWSSQTTRLPCCPFSPTRADFVYLFVLVCSTVVNYLDLAPDYARHPAWPLPASVCSASACWCWIHHLVLLVCIESFNLCLLSSDFHFHHRWLGPEFRPIIACFFQLLYYCRRFGECTPILFAFLFPIYYQVVGVLVCLTEYHNLHSGAANSLRPGSALSSPPHRRGRRTLVPEQVQDAM
jgi:hypothetical protein